MNNSPKEAEFPPQPITTPLEHNEKKKGAGGYTLKSLKFNPITQKPRKKKRTYRHFLDQRLAVGGVGRAKEGMMGGFGRGEGASLQVEAPRERGRKKIQTRKRARGGGEDPL